MTARVPPTARLATLDARGACAEALATYLRSLCFRRWGGEGDADESFSIEVVHEEWPDPARELVYPSVSIVDREDPLNGAHSLTPTALEETFEVFGPETALWKTGEASCTFQVDFWCNDIGTREAIAAGIPSAFAPSELASRVILPGSCRYYDRPVRASIATLPRRMDEPGSVYVRERRLMLAVLCEVDVVDLRCVTLLAPTVRLNVIAPPEEIPDTAESLDEG